MGLGWILYTVIFSVKVDLFKSITLVSIWSFIHLLGREIKYYKHSRQWCNSCIVFFSLWSYCRPLRCCKSLYSLHRSLNTLTSLYPTQLPVEWRICWYDTRQGSLDVHTQADLSNQFSDWQKSIPRQDESQYRLLKPKSDSLNETPSPCLTTLCWVPTRAVLKPAQMYPEEL